MPAALAAESLGCDCAACGQALVKVGEHVSEKIDCKPIEFFVRKDVYPQYACKACQTIVAEPFVPSILIRASPRRAC